MNSKPSERLLALRDLFTRKGKIQEITDALISSGYTKALGLHRKTAWTIIKKRHEVAHLSARTIERTITNQKGPFAFARRLNTSFNPREPSASCTNQADYRPISVFCSSLNNCLSGRHSGTVSYRAGPTSRWYSREHHRRSAYVVRRLLSAFGVFRITGLQVIRADRDGYLLAFHRRRRRASL